MSFCYLLKMPLVVSLETRTCRVMLLQAELLVRDVVLLEGLEQHEAGEAIFDDTISQAVVEVAKAIQDLHVEDKHQRHHMVG